MKSKLVLPYVSLLIGTIVLPGQTTAGRATPEPPQGARDVTVLGIPDVIAPNVKWTLVWQGTAGSVAGEPTSEFTRAHGANADGIVRTSDGGILFAQEQTSEILKLDKNGTVSVHLRDTHGAGALAVDTKGRILGVERTCTDPGGNPKECKEPTAVAVLAPNRKILADNFEGKSLGRLNDLVVDKRGGVYFNGAGTYYLAPSGKVSNVGQNIRTNGIMLSRDEKTFYVTNGKALVAFDVHPDGTVANQREFAKLEAGGNGDGMAIDSAGRLYVTSEPGIQVFRADGGYLGLIPTPRAVISVAFSGPHKKTLYVVGSGALGPDGREFAPPQGVRNNSKTIYKISMLAQGFKSRVK
jgi:gluconolactonase